MSITNRRRGRVRLLLWVAVALAALAACGDDGSTSTSATAPPTTATSSGDASAPLAVQVSSAGGFVPVEHALSNVPRLTVLTDGTVITAAAVPAIYPGPAMMPLRATTVSPADVESLIDRARAAGLLGPLDFGQLPIADAPTTVVTIVADGVTHQHRADALADLDPAGQSGAGGSEAIGGEAAENRHALQAFIAAADELVADGSGDHEWTPSQIAVTVMGSYQADASSPSPEPIDWPLASAPALPGASGEMPCTLVQGADAATLVDALRDANQRTPWIIGGAARAVAFRAVVPGDAGCP